MTHSPGRLDTLRSLGESWIQRANENPASATVDALAAGAAVVELCRLLQLSESQALGWQRDCATLARKLDDAEKRIEDLEAVETPPAPGREGEVK